MKVAALIQGEPRFCREFDSFLSRLQGYEEIDWFFHMWDRSPQTSDLLGGSGHSVVSPYWQSPSKDQAIEKLKNNLPKNHNIIKLELADQSEIVHEPVTENFAKETKQDNVWKMWHSQHRVNQLRIEHEKENSFEYDLVIKTRPDIGLNSDLDLTKVKDFLENRNDKVLIPSNKCCGYGVTSCDLFGIGNSKAMTVYCDLVNQAMQHHASGIIFHPETMLYHHLNRNGIKLQSYTFGLTFRDLGKWIDVETKEEFSSQTVRTWNNHIYISDFANWS